MSENDTPVVMLAAVEVPIESVEKELGSLWRTASQQGVTVRACSCNVVAVASDRCEAESQSSVLARVSEQYPCRSHVAFVENEQNRMGCGDDPHMHAWIGAHCTLPSASGPQICSEIIRVAAYGSAASNLHNTLAALLVSDLPVFVYWRSFNPEQQSLIEELARFADVLIVDSHVSKDDPHNRDRLLELLNVPPQGIAVRDLNWARLTPWRDLIAQFFDPPSARHLLHEISEVEIRRAVVPGSIPTRTLLLTGWLARRLQWKRVSAEIGRAHV
jgi:glucose-6-phosphate dehydrogenase assembly protein OpcA